MPLLNGSHGYGVVTKVLHWSTVLAIVAQFVIGLTMDADAMSARAEERVEAFEERGEERAEGVGEAAEERLEAEVERREEAVDAAEESARIEVLEDVVTGTAFRGGVTGLEAHLMVGFVVLLLGLARIVWRRATPLPPWAEHLDDRERTLESWLEKALLGVIGLHVALVVKHTVVRRHRHLSRMLWPPEVTDEVSGRRL
jgi:cytochrome b561